MTSSWKQIALDLGAENASTGSWARRVAVFIGAGSTPGQSWEEKITRFLGSLQDIGSWSRRLVDPHNHGTVGSWPRRLEDTLTIVDDIAPQGVTYYLLGF